MKIKSGQFLYALAINMAGIIDDYRLIKLVEANPILYDKGTSRGQRNASLKDTVWKNLSTKLQASERACITRWKSIRDRFGKEYRRVQENPNEPTNWDMFQHLLFLKDHYKHGNARNDAIEIKYEPKGRKRKPKNRWGDGKDEENEENDPEEILIGRQLIELVKQHPVLYDKQKIRDSKNLVLKNSAWDSISRKIGISEENCFKRWKKLRDRFAREYRYQVIMPERPVTWVFFNDLMFLEGHYRKGVPLKVENLKRKPKELMSAAKRPNVTEEELQISSSNDDAWCDEFNLVCAEESDAEMEEALAESEETTEETYLDIDHDIENLIILPNEKNDGEMSTTTEVLTEIVPVTNGEILSESSLNSSLPESITSEDQLANIISDMGTLIKRSEECLKCLQEENKRYKQELIDATQTETPGLLGKIKYMLNDLNSNVQTIAERKILKFLYECQINFLNNEDIEDVTISLPII